MSMNPERASFIMIQDLLGFNAQQIAERISAEIGPVTEDEVQTLLDSSLYQLERMDILEAFRRQSIKSAADELALATGDAVAFMRGAINNLGFKQTTRLRAAMDILDRVPQTSKSLRQFVQQIESGQFTDDQMNHLTETLKYIDAQRLPGEQLPEQIERENDLKQLIDVGEK